MIRTLVEFVISSEEEKEIERGNRNETLCQSVTKIYNIGLLSLEVPENFTLNNLRVGLSLKQIKSGKTNQIKSNYVIFVVP